MMQITYRLDGPNVALILSRLDPALERGAEINGYTRTGDRFVRELIANPAASNTAFLNRLVARSAAFMPRLLAQASGLEPPDWEQGLLLFLDRIEDHGSDWYLVGSASLAVRGIAVHPGDIDICTSEPDALRLQDLLIDELVQPVQDSTGWVGKWFGRAFVGAKFEWLGGVNETADAGGASDYGPVAQSKLETVRWHGYDIRVPPLDLMLAVSERRGLSERAALIEAAMKSAAS
jgi:hypothetical protein